MVRDYREIQVSSTALVIIILGIILLGAIIFFIGVQVGKKQADLLIRTMTAQKAEETVSAPVAVPPAEETTAAVSSQPAETSSGAPVQTPTQAAVQPAGKPASKPASSTTTSPPKTTATPSRPVAPPSGTFFIQVGAFTDRPSARLEAEKYRKQGYSAVVKEPFARDRKPFYRVWLGGYKTREEAQKALSELVSRSARNPGFFIVQQ
ncbi:MAG: SPOR domain-containing protein [Candidatus Aminicenantes bacterium]|nr:SPOR domain-containing protein [Candidatus Aminicenantes bacterium]